MTKYKQTIVVEAELYQPGMEDGIAVSMGVQSFTKPYIVSPDGTMFISPGDWIITMANGERYVCSPDVFETSYELMEGGAK